MSKRRGQRWTKCPQCHWTGPAHELVNHKRIHKEDERVAKAKQLADDLVDHMLAWRANTETLVEQACVLCDQPGFETKRDRLHVLLRWSKEKVRDALYQQIGFRALGTLGWSHGPYQFLVGQPSGFKVGDTVWVGDVYARITSISGPTLVVDSTYFDGPLSQSENNDG